MKKKYELFIKNIIEKFNNYKPKEIPFSNYKKSSVLVPIYQKNNNFFIIFIKRSLLLKHHKGEVSFPGGMHDDKDINLTETAIREAKEELGIKKNNIKIISALDDAITVSTNFLVRPYLSLINCKKFKPNPYEVEKIILIPIKNLLIQNAKIEYRISNNQISTNYSFYYRNILLWGATARILNNFLTMLRKFDLDKQFIY